MDLLSINTLLIINEAKQDMQNLKPPDLKMKIKTTAKLAPRETVRAGQAFNLTHSQPHLHATFLR